MYLTLNKINPDCTIRSVILDQTNSFGDSGTHKTSLIKEKELEENREDCLTSKRIFAYPNKRKIYHPIKVMIPFKTIIYNVLSKKNYD